jgi:hypothetical protein
MIRGVPSEINAQRRENGMLRHFETVNAPHHSPPSVVLHGDSIVPDQYEVSVNGCRFGGRLVRE